MFLSFCGGERQFFSEMKKGCKIYYVRISIFADLLKR